MKIHHAQLSLYPCGHKPYSRECRHCSTKRQGHKREARQTRDDVTTERKARKIDQGDSPSRDQRTQHLLKAAQRHLDDGELRLALDSTLLAIDLVSFDGMVLLRNLSQLPALAYSEEEQRQWVSLATCGDRSACFFVGAMLLVGRCGFKVDKKSAFRYFERASELGHVYAEYFKARSYQFAWGVDESWEKSLRSYLSAARLRCVHALERLGDNYRFGNDGFPLDINLACGYYREAERCGRTSGEVEFILRYHPMDAAPWDRWAPTVDAHQFVPLQVHTSAKLWTLISRRIGMVRDVALIVTKYLNTRDGWEQIENPTRIQFANQIEVE